MMVAEVLSMAVAVTAVITAFASVAPRSDSRGAAAWDFLQLAHSMHSHTCT